MSDAKPGDPARIWIIVPSRLSPSVKALARHLNNASLPSCCLTVSDAAAELKKGLRPVLVLLQSSQAAQIEPVLAANSQAGMLPRIYIAGSGARGREQAMASGAIDCIARPIVPSEMIARLRFHLQRIELDGELALRNRQFRTMLDNIGQGVCLFDASKKLVLHNAKYAEVYGLPPDAVQPGMTLKEIAERRYDGGTGPVIPHKEYLEFCDTVNSSALPQDWTAELQSGRIVRVHHERTLDGGWVSTHEDITEYRAAERKIAHLTTHDPLTDLPNRSALTQHLTDYVRARREQDKPFAILSLDLDRFKEINEARGHAVGDRVLCEVARRLRKSAADAFVARSGGDEFALILDADIQTTADRAEDILRMIADEIVVGTDHFKVSVSIGAAMFPVDGLDAGMLLTNADFALHRAKAESRGVIRFFAPQVDEGLRQKRQLQQDLRKAISHNQLTVCYQPLASICGDVIGFEALLRWTHPLQGAIAPSIFIPMAEESDLIQDVGEWVLREACMEAASWSADLQIAVNLSPAQFRDGDLVGTVRKALRDSGLPAHRLELEITEGVLIDDLNAALSTLKRLKGLGVRIAMDDFGTGYSSLSYLRSFPFDKIKIDQSFIRDVETRESAAIIRAAIGLGHGLHLPVVVEGVETESQLQFLRQEQCDQVQGYLIGRPLPISEYALHLVRFDDRCAI